MSLRKGPRSTRGAKLLGLAAAILMESDKPAEITASTLGQGMT